MHLRCFKEMKQMETAETQNKYCNICMNPNHPINTC